MRKSLFLLCLSILSGGFILAAPEARSAGHLAAPVFTACTATAPPVRRGDYKPVAAECGHFRVPENYDAPNGRQLDLKVVRLPARGKAAPREPVFILAGGPGQAATDLAAEFAGSDYRDARDIYFMDVRGTDAVNGLDCAQGGSDADAQAYLNPLFAEGKAYASCRDELAKRADLRLYTLPLAMRDVDNLRAALGFDKVILNGGSYGTRATLAYIRAYGRHVRAAVLSGLAPVDNRTPLYHAAAAQRAFDLLAAQCRADAGCHAAYGDIGADLSAILAQLRAAPARVTVRHPATGAPVAVTLSADAFGDGLRVMLYSEEQARRVPLLLRRGRAGDLAPFAEAALKSSRGLVKQLRLGMLLSASCSEDVWRIRPEEVAAATAGSFIGDARVRGQMAACSVWPRGAMPADYYTPFRSDVPVLLISGELDPVTPPDWAEKLRATLPNSVHVVLPTGHVPFNPCVENLSVQAAEVKDIRAIDTSCVRAMRYPAFVLPDSTAAGGGG